MKIYGIYSIIGCSAWRLEGLSDNVKKDEGWSKLEVKEEGSEGRKRMEVCNEVVCWW